MSIELTFPQCVAQELRLARQKHRPLNSAHEAYAVILEELDEFWEQVRLKREDREPIVMLVELVQIATMAQRAAEDLRVCLECADDYPPIRGWIHQGGTAVHTEGGAS